MLKSYQVNPFEQAMEILQDLKIAYLVGEMRTGKSYIAMEMGKATGARRILCATTRMARPGLLKAYKSDNYADYFALDVITWGSLHKYDSNYDLFIADEAHKLGAFPKPSQRARKLKAKVGSKPLILMSGTPSPESHCQLYHQFDVSEHSPFKFKNFYRFADEYVVVQEKRVGTGQTVKDYSNKLPPKPKYGKKLAEWQVLKSQIEEMNARILQKTTPYMVPLSRTDAGFKHPKVYERFATIALDPRLKKTIDRLNKDGICKFSDGSVIVADTPAKKMQKAHQLSSGTIKIGLDRRVLVSDKAKFIADNYSDKKCAILYKFIAEGNLLRDLFPNWTDNDVEFTNDRDKVFIAQVQSAAEGVDLSAADILIFYNIDFSASTYWQSRDRMLHYDRTKPPEVLWLFTDNGIERDVYDAVADKKDYTTIFYRQKYLRN